MPKLVPIITDWSEEERLALVRKWHPAPVYSVRREPNLDKSLGNGSDQEAWYMVVSEQTVANERFDTTKGNHHPLKLTVAQCLKELGPR